MRNKFAFLNVLMTAFFLGTLSFNTIATEVVVADTGLVAAVDAAESGDVLILKNGVTYAIKATIYINKTITIKSETEPTLSNNPNEKKLDNLPIIIADTSVSLSRLIMLQDSGEITLTGIELDGTGVSKHCIDPDSDGTMTMYISLSRIHNSPTDGIGSGNRQLSFMKEQMITNCFIYDNGAKPVYTRDFAGHTNVEISNNTFWNNGQQFNYIKWYDDPDNKVLSAEMDAKIVIEHNTIVLCPTEGATKELFGVAGSQELYTEYAPIAIEIKNNIIAYQGTADRGVVESDRDKEKYPNNIGDPFPEFSIVGNVTMAGTVIGSIKIENNCAWGVDPIADVNGDFGLGSRNYDGTPAVNWFTDVNPWKLGDVVSLDTAKFSNGSYSEEDFNITTDDVKVIRGADDGSCLGASYWWPYKGDTTTYIDTQIACGSYTWIDGKTYTENNDTATYILINSSKGDSLITLNLTILNSTTYTDSQMTCVLTWIDGNTYIEDNNSATYTLTNSQGCDSIVTLNLTIKKVDTDITITDSSIIANAVGASYQWLDCSSNYGIILGKNEQSYNLTKTGNFAVKITQGDCVDTSECINISIDNGTNDINNPLFSNVSIFPNPNSGNFSIELGSLKDVNISIFNTSGQLVYEKHNINTSNHKFNLNQPNGVYILELTSQEEKQRFKVVVE